MYKIYRVPDQLPCNATPEKPLKVVASAKSSKGVDFMWVSLMLHHPTHIYRNVAYYRNEAEYDVSQEDFLGDLSLVRVMKCSKDLENPIAQYVFREFKRMLNAYGKNGGKLRLNFDTWEVFEPQEDGSLKLRHTLSQEGWVKKCVICQKSFKGFGNNPEPLRRWIEGACCDECNFEKVIPARIKLMEKK